jgi:antitoxin YqcF
MNANIATNLPDHYERNLGQIVRGWSDDKRAHGIQIVSFDRQPEEGVSTYATLGLSDHVVSLSESRQIRQELLMSANATSNAEMIASLMLWAAEFVLARNRALLRGEVVGLGAEMCEGFTLSSIYVTNPSPFNASLTEFQSAPATVFAYLVPITEAEGALVRSKGWRWFEEELERQNPDIWDLKRQDTIQFLA